MQVVRLAGALLLHVLVVAQNALGQELDVEEQLRTAKVLYQEARFDDAIVSLKQVVERLAPIAHLGRAREQLADAHVTLGLVYFALRKQEAAKESFKTALRNDSTKRLDPEIYAPAVVTLFEEALLEAARDARSASLREASQPANPKRSKAPVVALAGAGLAAAGVAAFGGGGSGPASASSSAPPAPSPTPALANDVSLVTAEPPGGSTVSIASRPTATVLVSATVAGSVPRLLQVILVGPADRNCLTSTARTRLDPGPQRTIAETLPLQRLLALPACRLPMPLDLELFLLDEGGGIVLRRVVPALYSMTP